MGTEIENTKIKTGNTRIDQRNTGRCSGKRKDSEEK
jgi:hypothetical protein